MKAASFAFAVIFALTGAVFANDKDARPVKSSAEKVQQEQLVDPNPTGSIRVESQGSSKEPRIGIDLNPFSFGTFH